MTDYVHVGSHADVLASGSVVAPGERITDDALDAEDRHLVDEGRLMDVKFFEGGNHNEVLSGKELQKRAGELEIEGRSNMTAEELRSAVAEREAQEA